jgi:uncharacterized protein YyaL (SSP411 family)
MRYSLLFLLPLLFILSCKSGDTPQQHQHTNALINESSPYLLQHAHNPVNWQPWGEAALQKAQKEDKLILVSVGYAACHWCHVMEHESFEDTTVARIMNEHFVSIKVDREERPDVDNIYMTACQLAGEGSCGWPLNAFALPNGQPVWAGTYFPKDQWVEILNYFADLYQNDRAKLEEYGALLADGIRTMEAPTPPSTDVKLDPELLEQVAEQIHEQADRRLGGMKGAPKFPLPSIYQFLLQESFLNEDETSLQIVEETLDAMASGGIYDHIGGGFARYSTDAKWLVPHFEKMLYDNAQLVSLYSNAFKQTGKERYQEVIKETLVFVEREMMAPNGGFYSSLDADSEGEEGRFYVWTASEIDALLEDEQQTKLFKAYYGVSESGNWEGVNVLHQQKNAEEIQSEYGLSPSELKSLLNDSKQTLFKARAKRERPGLDDKQLTSWNALMITAYADAYQALKEPAYQGTAVKAGEFLANSLMQAEAADGQYRLMRSYKDKEAYINGFLDDYAFTIQAFVKLYSITFDEMWLERAKGLADYATVQFGAEESALFYFTSAEDDPLIARQVKTEDNVIPSANSAMARSLLQLGTYLYDTSYVARARRMMQTVAPKIQETKAPSYFANWMRLYGELAYPLYEVAIVGPDYNIKRAELQGAYLPNALFLGGEDEGNLELLKGKLQDGETFIYVCQNKVCQLPVQEADLAIRQME